MMFLDDEIDVIDCISQDINNCKILMYNGNSFNKKLFHYLKNLDKFICNNAHNALPPDFYSDEFCCMFDMMRINDSEIKKSYNPAKIRERNAEKEIKASGILDIINPNATILINSESDNYKEHTMENYRRNCNRVMAEHIKKINVWKSEHPNIKYKGLLICDETECYFEGYILHANGDQYNFIWDANKALVLHEPWMDKTFIENAYDSDLDFIVWFFPYKPYSSFLKQIHYDYPELVILDTRFSRTDYTEYDISKFVRM